MAVLSLRIDDDLKKSLEIESQKKGVSLSECAKKLLKNGLLDMHVLETEKNLEDSKIQIENLTQISNEAIQGIEDKIKKMGAEAENFNYTSQIKKLNIAMIGLSVFICVCSMPVMIFTLKYIV
jgi:hypothetical protein